MAKIKCNIKAGINNSVIFCKLVESKPLNQVKQTSPSVHFVCLTEFEPVGLRLVFLYTVHLEPCHLLPRTVTAAFLEQALSKYLFTGTEIKFSS